MKAEHIEKTMMKQLNMDEDYEIFVECCMLAGTHYLNAALHKKEITVWNQDLLHSDKPPLDSEVPPSIAEIMTELKFIEEVRPGYLRGNNPWRHEDGIRCLEYYQKVKSDVENILAG